MELTCNLVRQADEGGRSASAGNPAGATNGKDVSLLDRISDALFIFDKETDRILDKEMFPEQTQSCVPRA